MKITNAQRRGRYVARSQRTDSTSEGRLPQGSEAAEPLRGEKAKASKVHAPAI
jgi:hypothetical protein